MAATTGTGTASSRSSSACAPRDSASPSIALRMALKSLMSAPAMKLSGLPLRRTTATTAPGASSSVISASSSAIIDLPSVFTRSPGTSMVRTRTPSSPISRVRARRSGA